MENHSKLLIAALLTSIMLAGLHFLALAFYLYWVFWWFDILTHFTGGLFIGFALLWLSTRFNMFRNPLLQLFFATVIVGVGWEMFEYFFGLYSKSNYFVDTAIDIIMAVTGAYAAYVLAVRFHMYTILGTSHEN